MRVAATILMVISGAVFARSLPALAQTLAQYSAAVSSKDRPAWLRLTPGREVYLGPEGTGHETAAIVCQTLAEVHSGLVNGPDASACPLRPAGQRVIFQSLNRVAGYGGQIFFEADITAKDGAWQGYVSATQLIPIPPNHTRLRAALAPYGPPLNQPRLYSSQYTSIDRNGVEPAGLSIGEVGVELLRYDPVVYRSDADGHQALVQVLDGTYRGRIGWISADYLRTQNGYPIFCFCGKT